MENNNTEFFSEIHISKWGIYGLFLSFKFCGSLPTKYVPVVVIGFYTQQFDLCLS